MPPLEIKAETREDYRIEVSMPLPDGTVECHLMCFNDKAHFERWRPYLQAMQDKIDADHPGKP